MQFDVETPARARGEAAPWRPAAGTGAGQAARPVRWTGLVLGLVASMALGMAAACGEWIDFLLRRKRIRRAMAAALAGGNARAGGARPLLGAVLLVFLAFPGCRSTRDHVVHSAARMGETLGELVHGDVTLASPAADVSAILDGPSLDVEPLLFTLKEVADMSGAGEGLLMTGAELWTPAGPDAWWTLREIILP